MLLGQFLLHLLHRLDLGLPWRRKMLYLEVMFLLLILLLYFRAVRFQVNGLWFQLATILFSPQEGQCGRGWVLQARGLEGFRSHVRQGLRRREYNSSVALLDDSPPQGGGLQLQGPRPSMNTGFELRRFPEVTGLFIRARRCMRRILESMLTIYRMNVPALQSAELLIRRMMVIREAHKVSPSAPDYSSADIMMGWQYRRSAQAVVTAMARGN